MERRKPSKDLKSAPLPIDFLRMVNQVFAQHFGEALQKLNAIKPKPYFETYGQVFPDEVMLVVSLQYKDKIVATTAYASADYDPKASAPTVEDLLGHCVDATAAIFDSLMLNAKNPKALERLAEDSLAALEDVPFDWSPVEIAGKRVYVKIDKAHPGLETMTDAWLEKNDPEHKARVTREQQEMEDLIVTADKAKAKVGKSGAGTSGGGILH